MEEATYHLLLASAGAVIRGHKINPNFKIGRMVNAVLLYTQSCDPKDAMLQITESREIRDFYLDVQCRGRYPRYKEIELKRNNIDLLTLVNLNQCDYIPASKIAQKLEISDKTLRGRIKELNQELVTYGAQVEMRHGKGYRLDISDYEQYEVWNKSLAQKTKKHIPTTVRERIQYILLMLLSNKSYIKREMIGDFLYVSEKTVFGDLKQIEHIFNKYNLSIEKRSGYGMRVVGTEFAKRQCIMNHYLTHHGGGES